MKAWVRDSSCKYSVPVRDTLGVLLGMLLLAIDWLSDPS